MEKVDLILAETKGIAILFYPPAEQRADRMMVDRKILHKR
jgi:hypothetical protein